jgi:lactoylglutathione lyase
VPDAILTDRCQPAPYSGRMFERDLTTITLATPERLWPLYTDVSRWPEWDEAVVQVTLDGPFASGTGGTLAPRGGRPLPIRLTDVTPHRSFTHELPQGAMTVRVRHRLERLTGGTRIVHQLCVEGAGALEVGEGLVASVERALALLAAKAAEGQAPTLGGVILYTPDVPRTVDFYRRALGLEVALEAPGGTYVQLAGAVPLAFVSEADLEGVLPLPVRRSRAGEAPPAVELLFVFADVEAAYARAVAAGATPVSAPAAKPWGQVVAYVRDLDGVLIELCSPWG